MVAGKTTASNTPGIVKPRRRRDLYVEVPILGFGLVVVLGIIFPGILSARPWTLLDFASLVLFGGIAITFVLFFWMDFVQMTAALTRDFLRLPFYLHPLSAHKRTVLLSEIADVVPSLDGADIYLKGGRRIFLDRRYFGSNGAEAIDRLASHVGKSYLDAVEDALSKELMVVTLDAKRMKGDTIHLTRSLFSYSGKTVMSLRPQDVAEAQGFRTKTGKAGYRMELMDGSPFFLSMETVDRLRLRAHSRWAAKLP